MKPIANEIFNNAMVEIDLSISLNLLIYVMMKLVEFNLKDILKEELI